MGQKTRASARRTGEGNLRYYRIIELTGYSNPIRSFRRFLNKKAKRASSGLLIYIKDILRKGIKLIKNEIDSIVWIKLEKDFFQTKSDRYIAAVYIPPVNFPSHNFFQVL